MVGSADRRGPAPSAGPRIRSGIPSSGPRVYFPRWTTPPGHQQEGGRQAASSPRLSTLSTYASRPELSDMATTNDQRSRETAFRPCPRPPRERRALRLRRTGDWLTWAPGNPCQAGASSHVTVTGSSHAKSNDNCLVGKICYVCAEHRAKYLKHIFP